MVLRGLTNNSTEVRDDQIGLGASYTLNERNAIGATLFGSSFIQRFAYINNLSVFPDPSSPDASVPWPNWPRCSEARWRISASC